MGTTGSRIKWPGAKYLKNFNIENRAIKKLDQQEKKGWVEISPRHPSTAKALKEMEEKAPQFDEFEVNKKLVESSRNIKITGKGPEHQEELLAVDKRPRKENEMSFASGTETKLDVDFEKYGYVSPAKIRPGFLTLRQFDELANQYKHNKSIEFLNQFAVKHNVDVTNLHILLEYYKPFVRLNTRENNKDAQQTPKQINASEDAAKQLFPNLK